MVSSLPFAKLYIQDTVINRVIQQLTAGRVDEKIALFGINILE